MNRFNAFFIFILTFSAINLKADDFYSELCQFRKEFEVERLFREDILNEIVDGSASVCHSSLTEYDDKFSQALAQLMEESQKKNEFVKDENPHRHLKSLLIGLAMSYSWDKLSFEERLSLRTHASCDSGTSLFKLPKFSRLHENPGPGDPELEKNLGDLCLHSFSRLLEKMPKFLILDAFYLLNESGFDTRVYKNIFCKESKVRLNENNFFAKLYAGSNQRGSLKNLSDVKNLFGLSPQNTQKLDDDVVLNQNLSTEEIEAIKAWKGSGYIWVSNREEFGFLGDAFSFFHRNGGLHRKPDNLGKNVSQLKDTLNQLPPHEGLVFRGQNESDPEENYRVGESFEFDRLSSTSTSVNVAYDFSSDGPGSSVVLILLTKSGRNIMGIGPNKGEREVLFPPGVRFKVVDTVQTPYHFKVYAIEE